MTHDQDPELETHAEHQEPILSAGMVRGVEPDRVVVQKHCLGLFKGYPMFSDVLLILGFIPLEAEIMHMYIVHNKKNAVNGERWRGRPQKTGKSDRPPDAAF